MLAHTFLTTAAAIALAAAPALAKDDFTKPAGKDWPVVGGDWNNSRYSTLDKINTSNVKGLGGAWVKKFDPGLSRVTPVVVDGVMYVTYGQ
jgi:glucose dehydrogenase